MVSNRRTYPLATTAAQTINSISSTAISGKGSEGFEPELIAFGDEGPTQRPAMQTLLPFCYPSPFVRGFTM